MTVSSKDEIRPIAFELAPEEKRRIAHENCFGLGAAEDQVRGWGFCGIVRRRGWSEWPTPDPADWVENIGPLPVT